MISTQKMFAALLTGILVAYASTAPAAVVITTPGGGSGYDESNLEKYLSTDIPKSWDPDGDGAYGTLGRFVFGQDSSSLYVENPVTAYTFGPTGNAVKVGATWTNTYVPGPTVTYIASGIPSYAVMDNPNAAINVDALVADWVANSGISTISNGTAGTSDIIMSFNIDGSAPAGFRVGMFIGNATDHPTINPPRDPAEITLSGPGDSATISGLPTLFDRQTSWAFFDVVTNGDTGTFSISLTRRTTGNDSWLGGITFDELEVQDVPEPSTYALGLIGLAGLGLFARRRRKGERPV